MDENFLQEIKPTDPWYIESPEKEKGPVATKTKRSDNTPNKPSKRVKYNSKSESDSKATSAKKELETDSNILQRRQKQIDYGKNTVGYHKYLEKVPIDLRTKDHPKTPDKYIRYSRRSWDALIKMWRKKLHKYDPDVESSTSSDIENGS